MAEGWGAGMFLAQPRYLGCDLVRNWQAQMGEEGMRETRSAKRSQSKKFHCRDYCVAGSQWPGFLSVMSLTWKKPTSWGEKHS